MTPEDMTLAGASVLDAEERDTDALSYPMSLTELFEICDEFDTEENPLD